MRNMQALTIKVQKHEGIIPITDCNNIIIGDYNIGAVYGTLKMGTDDFDKRFKIAYVRYNNHCVAMLWNVTEVIYLPMEVKA